MDVSKALDFLLLCAKRELIELRVPLEQLEPEERTCHPHNLLYIKNIICSLDSRPIFGGSIGSKKEGRVWVAN